MSSWLSEESHDLWHPSASPAVRHVVRHNIYLGRDSFQGHYQGYQSFELVLSSMVEVYKTQLFNTVNEKIRRQSARGISAWTRKRETQSHQVGESIAKWTEEDRPLPSPQRLVETFLYASFQPASQSWVCHSLT